MKRGRLSQRVKNVRRQPAAPSKGGWRLLAWCVKHELAFILCGALVFGLLMLLGHAGGAFFGPANEVIAVLSVLWLVGVFLFTVLVMDGNPKYRKWGAWICAGTGALAGAGIGWICSASPQWIGAFFALGALLGVTKPVWLLKFF